MKLSKEAISYILDLQKNKLPQVYCVSNFERLENLEKAIVNYNGKVESLDSLENNSTKTKDTLLIFIDELNDENVLYVEKALMSLNNVGAVLLEIGGINSSINKRNLALSFLSRYNLDVIKGAKEEVQTLINFQNNNVIQMNKDINFKYRDFAKKNNTVLVIEGENYYITDGYSEFSIKNTNKDFFLKDLLEDIHSGMLAVGLGVCKNKCEIIQSILISTLAFGISELYASRDNLQYYCENKERKEKNYEILFRDYLLNEVKNVDVEKIKSYGNIKYGFKR